MRTRQRQLPKRTLLQCIAYLLYLMITVPLRRLFRCKAVVPRSTIRREIGIRYLRFMLHANLESARNIEKQVARFVNSRIKDPIEEVVGDGFRGVWIGDSQISRKHRNPIIFYCHGGGYSLCNALTYLDGISQIRRQYLWRCGDNMRVFSLEYSLAPEHKFSKQISEALSAFKYVAEKYPLEPIILMGDSAGGNLILAMLQCFPNDGPLPEAAILISPWVNVDSPPLSYPENKDTDFVTLEQLQDMTQRFVPSGVDLRDPLISPINANLSDIFCPLFIHYGENELFAGDIEEFILKAQSARLRVHVVKEAMAPHITPLMGPFFPEMAMRGQLQIAQFCWRFRE